MYFLSFLPVVSRYSLSIQPFLNLSAYSQWSGMALFYNFVFGRLCATRVLGMSSWCQDLPCKLPGILAAALEPYSSSSPVDTSLGWTGAWPEGGGGTDLERGYGDVRPWRPPFHASPAARKGPISSKRVSSQDPILRKFGNFGPYSLNFHPNFSSQAPKFGNFQLTSPQIWKFSAHKPPRGKCQFASPTLRKSGPHTPAWKKLSAPPPRCMVAQCCDFARDACFVVHLSLPSSHTHLPHTPTPNNPTHRHTHKPSYSFILTRKEIYFAYELQITSVPKSYWIFQYSIWLRHRSYLHLTEFKNSVNI